MPTKILSQKEKRDELSVNCELTYRWVRFSKTYSDSENRKVVLVDVMTTEEANRSLADGMNELFGGI